MTSSETGREEVGENPTLFESSPHGLVVMIHGFHPCDEGSIPSGGTLDN